MPKEIPMNEYTANVLETATQDVKMTPEFLMELALGRFLREHKTIA